MGERALKQKVKSAGSFYAFLYGVKSLGFFQLVVEGGDISLSSGFLSSTRERIVTTSAPCGRSQCRARAKKRGHAKVRENPDESLGPSPLRVNSTSANSQEFSICPEFCYFEQSISCP